MLISPSGRTVVVTQPDDTFNIIDLLLVTDLEIKPDLSIQKTPMAPHLEKIDNGITASH